MDGIARRVRRRKNPDLAVRRGSGDRQRRERRGVRYLVVLLGAAAAVLLVRNLGAFSRTEQLAMGEGATTTLGNRVTVFDYVEVASFEDDPSPEVPLSGIRLESCRNSPDRPKVNAGRFSLEMPGGRTVAPEGSELEVVNESCVRGTVFFRVEPDEKPRSVVFDGGSSRVEWVVD